MNNVICNPELNFGGFAHLVDLCRNNANVSTQSDVIAKMVSVIDPNNRCISLDTIAAKDISSIEGEKTFVNHLIKCTQAFKLTSSFDELLKEKSQILEKFKEFVNNYLDSDKTPMLVMILIYIMANDTNLRKQNRELFKEIFGCYLEEYFPQKEISVYNFLLNILLYTVSPRFDKKITSANISHLKFNELYDFYNPYINDIIYDNNSQTVTLSFLDDFEFLNETMSEFEIAYFLCKIDPSYYTGLDDEWIDRTSDFYEKSYNHLLKDQPNSFFKELIYKFIKNVDDYNNFLGLEMVYEPSRSKFFYKDYDEAAFGERSLTWREKCRKSYESINDYVSMAYGVPTVNQTTAE